MKIFLTLILIFLSSVTFGQFAIIQDKEGYCNVRDSANAAANVIDTLKNGHFVYCFEKKGNWTDIGYLKNGEELNGYVDHSRLKIIDDYVNLPVVTKAQNSVTLGKGSVRVIVAKQGFDKRKYKISYQKEEKSQIELINGQPIWGTDGEMPHSEYKSIIIFVGQQKIVLPKTAIANLFEPDLDNTEVNYDKTNNIIYVQSANSDGAGYYRVVWKIEKGIYKNRYMRPF